MIGTRIGSLVGYCKAGSKNVQLVRARLWTGTDRRHTARFWSSSVSQRDAEPDQERDMTRSFRVRQLKANRSDSWLEIVSIFLRFHTKTWLRFD